MLPESRLQTKLLILLQFLTAARHSSATTTQTQQHRLAGVFLPIPARLRCFLWKFPSAQNNLLGTFREEREK